ncbi:ribonuclease III [Parahalioglobus pacificus]|uniref:Ribonuclease 3 n=1 Tax=Parahalioglobus pacificus TaxID=930806 RepID=A0A918XFD4_9GAMM|nr:ribonuclease III [Halioglobus pacificus]GHD28382.1 ribonuclease 3 [Halioglobus pacificus]
MDKLERLQRALGYSFSDPALLQLALTHRSAGRTNNERLEFLGDSIVNHVIAEALYQKLSSSQEGSLSRVRASLVCGDTLAEIGRELELGDYLRLGTGERKSGGHRRGSILADTVEAIAGAILLDSDVDTCRRCLLAWFDSRLRDLDQQSDGKDAKTRLQELLQGRGQALPEYQLLGVTGKDHAQVFTVSCTVQSQSLVTEGTGSSRRKAEQQAAAEAVERLNHG